VRACVSVWFPVLSSMYTCRMCKCVFGVWMYTTCYYYITGSECVSEWHVSPLSTSSTVYIGCHDVALASNVMVLESHTLLYCIFA
jgi:hypothetical protein